ncbi:helix-turn-helix domain-containing protein [Rhodoglobus sp.]
MPTIGITNFKDLGAVVKVARQAQGIRQEDIAETLGFSRNYLREIESGKPNLFASRLFRTLNKLGIRVTVTYELTHQGSEFDEEQSESGARDGE